MIYEHEYMNKCPLPNNLVCYVRDRFMRLLDVQKHARVRVKPRRTIYSFALPLDIAILMRFPAIYCTR